jgi:hypothetical protein
MVIAKLYGGLGNQMFQYAAGKQLALLNKTELLLDITHYEKLTLPNDLPYRSFDLSIFKADLKIAKKQQIEFFKSSPSDSLVIRVRRKIRKIFFNYKTICESHFHFYPEFLTSKGNIYIDGYWQSEKYFKQIENQIRKDFTIKTTLNRDGTKLLFEIQSCNSVCLNVRRKELATNKYHSHFLGVEYFHDAVKFISAKIDNPHFYIFSDELQWCKENLKINQLHTFVEESLYGDKFRDCLYLMTQCKNHIIPNSSFGWWATWLNPSKEKIVITPKKWFADNSKNTSDLMLIDWIRL